MIYLLAFWVIQWLLDIGVTIWNKVLSATDNKICKGIEGEEKDWIKFLQDSSVDEANMLIVDRNLKLLDVNTFLLSLIPVIGIVLSIGILYFHFVETSTILNLLNEKFEEYSSHKELEGFFTKLPLRIRELLQTIKNIVSKLEEENYHAVIAVESQDILHQLIRESFFNENIPDGSLDVIEKNCRDLLMILKKMQNRFEEEKLEVLQNHQKSVKEKFEKYQSFLTGLNQDLEKRQGVF